MVLVHVTTSDKSVFKPENEAPRFSSSGAPPFQKCLEYF